MRLGPELFQLPLQLSYYFILFKKTVFYSFFLECDMFFLWLRGDGFSSY